MRPLRIALTISLLVLQISAARADDITLEGGDTTVDNSTAKAYNQVAPNINDLASDLRHEKGNTGFIRDFSKVKVGGQIRLGPTFNGPSCISCHGGNGRGQLRITPGRAGSDTAVKVSATTGTPALPGGPIPVPHIGLQVRDHAMPGSSREGSVRITWATTSGAYTDTIPYELRSPNITLTNLPKGAPTTMMKSLRRAPPVFGSGLLDAVPQDTIIALADPDDANADGISGRANMVWDVRSRSTKVGKFGFKAGAPSLLQQIAGAYATDMGVTNPLFKPPHELPELPLTALAATTFYTATLGVPMARNQNSASVIQGKALFASIGCESCHLPTLVTGTGSHSSLSHQTIHPFTDLLLHDMGDGLADGRPEFLATGHEWRTTPLWGIGLTETVLGGKPATYLHDGRARTLEEAILWHGGEAERSRAQFVDLAASERDALIQFLRSL
jgi:CxxC motif-containing protein (DUF1111 family)